MRGQSESLKVSSLPSLQFFFLCVFCLFFYLRRRRCQEKVLEMEVQKQEGKSRSQKWKPKWELESKLPPFFAYFFFSMVFFLCFFSFAWKEKNARRKHLKWKCKSERVEARVKSEKVKREFENKLPSFYAFFFFSMVFFFYVCFFFFCLKKRRCQEKAFEMEVQKQEGRNGSQKWEGRARAWR